MSRALARARFTQVGLFRRRVAVKPLPTHGTYKTKGPEPFAPQPPCHCSSLCFRLCCGCFMSPKGELLERGGRQRPRRATDGAANPRSDPPTEGERQGDRRRKQQPHQPTCASAPLATHGRLSTSDRSVSARRRSPQVETGVCGRSPRFATDGLRSAKGGRSSVGDLPSWRRMVGPQFSRAMLCRRSMEWPSALAFVIYGQASGGPPCAQKRITCQKTHTRLYNIDRRCAWENIR